MTKEYIEREAAKDAVCKAFVRWGSEDQYHESTHQIDRIPAADVVPVVRCKDCRKGIPDSEHATAYSCYGIWHKPDWFCAGGVRKDGDGE